MNKIEEKILVLLVGDYILDEMTKNSQIEMLLSPFKYLRNNYLKFKIKSLENDK